MSTFLQSDWLTASEAAEYLKVKQRSLLRWVRRLWQAPNSVSKALRKVNSLWPNPRFVIALHSPNALLETGLLMCPSEKNWDSDDLCCRAVHSLQSVLWTKYYEIRACFAYFGVTGGEISRQLRLAGGESGIRNHRST
jgi:hypothetical protein